MEQLDINTLLQIVTVAIIVLGARWQLPTKDDIKRLEDRFDKQGKDFSARIDKLDAKFEERFDKQDTKFEERFAQQDAKFEERFAQQDAKFEERFDKQDDKLERLRLEIKSDIQRVEDRTAEANEFHAKSVALLDGILRQLQERREPL